MRAPSTTRDDSKRRTCRATTSEEIIPRPHSHGHPRSTIGARPFGFEYRDGDAYATRDVPGRLFVNNTLSFQNAVRAGLGFIQCPLVGVRTELASGALIEILPDYVAEPLPVSLIYPRRRHQARRVRAFMDWLAGIVQEYLN